MIEKIMKAVKSNNKKRGRNITVGAVVGMLLSCTVAMGADEVGLEITQDTSGIKFSKDYTENTWENDTYTNNTTIVATSYGIKLSGDLGEMSFKNNGKITASSTSPGGSSYGISVANLAGELKNNGEITSSGGTYGSGYGIYVTSGLNGNLTNNGKITGTASSGYGIYVTNLAGELKNNGEITAFGTGSSSYGILLDGKDASSHSNITNTGVIYGKKNAIKVYKGTLEALYNYGLLVAGETITDGTITKLNNYGLAFKDVSGTYSATDDDFSKFGTISTEGEYTVINAKAENNNKDDIGGTKSLTLEDGKLYSDADDIVGSEISDFSSDKQYVLNGIENTLKVSGENNKLNNSRVNAYETAVVMGEDNSILTLDNTVVNGGMKEDTTTISITENGSALTVKGDSVINVRDGGVAIAVDGDDNAVVLKGNTIVNGKMEANGERNILDLDGTGKDGMNMHHDITGFEKMAIDNNVTFFEDMEVTGTTEVTVEGTGVLKKEVSPKAPASVDDTPPKATHAFSGTDGMTIEGISPEEAGTLNFITNGIGRVIDVDMTNIALKNMKIKASSIIDKAEIHKDFIRLGAGSALGEIVNPKEVKRYGQLNKIYKSIYSSREENLDGLRDILSLSTYLGKNYDYNNRTDEEQLASLLGYLTSVYIESPYSYSSELSRRSMGMFRDIVTENEFRPNLNNWLIMGGLTHADGGTKDTYYGQNYHEIDGGTAETSADMKLTGAYMLAKYGYSENLSLGLTLEGNKSEAKMDVSKVKGNSGYLGAFAENYRGNLTLKAGAGVQYSEYDADRRITGDSYSDKYSDMAYDIYLNGRYSNPMGDNLFLEPYATLSYTYIDQDGANEGNKTLAIETDSKSFDYTVGKVGVDLKKVIPHEKGKSTLTAGVSYTKILDGADEEHITGRFKGGSDFDILVAHKNEQSIGLNAKYALELENGVVFDVKGSYSVEEDSHNSSSKNKSKGEWIVGAGIGYKF